MYIWGFSILVILFEWFDLEIDLDLSTVFYVSVFWVYLDLSNGLTVSVLSTVLLDACDLSILLTASFFPSEIGGVVDYSTTVCFDFPSLWTM